MVGGLWLVVGGWWLVVSRNQPPTTGHQPLLNLLQLQISDRARQSLLDAYLLRICGALLVWGEFPTLDRKLPVEQGDLLDLFMRREVSGHFIYFLLEILDDPRMARQFGVVSGFDAE